MAASSVLSVSPSPIWNKVQVCLGKPLYQRCPELEQILVNSSQKDLSAVLPGLLENIFGFGSEPGWGLDSISRGHNGVEYDALMKLLGPEGPLMSLVCNLQTDPYLTFEFPSSCLPGPTRHMIEDGSLPMFYINKLQYQGYSKPLLALGAFELYMFYFCHTLVSPNWQQKSLNWINITDIVYPSLVDVYMRHFLPLNRKALPRFPQMSSPGVRSTVLQQSSMSVRQSPGTGNQTRSRSRLGLLKASILSPQKSHSQASPGAERAEGDIWWSQTFVQIVAEFWLNQNAHDCERGITPQNLRKGWQTRGLSDMFFESFMPSNNHIRLVRLVLKHLHYFVNSVEPETINSAYTHMESSPLDEFKRSLFPSVLQKKIYCFLRHGFERWPLDSSFRLMLETWLTFIQPWRYKDPTTPVGQGKDTDRVTDNWFPFIRDNFLFYTAIFQEFLQRSHRMLLTSTHNAYIVFRVTKVFSLPGLPQLLREAEKTMYNCGYGQVHDMGGSYISPDISAILRIQISELERPDFQYVNMFGREMHNEVQQLIQQMVSAKTTLETHLQQPTKKAEKSGLMSFFDMSSFFEDTSKAFGDMSFSEVKKLVTHLDQALNQLCYIFGMKVSEQTMLYAPQSPNEHLHTPIRPGCGQTSQLNTSLPSLPVTPDCQQTDYGPQLTPAGRLQLINGQRKFDLGYHGDPDLQPIRSFENTTLVRVLHRLSSFLNKMFESEIQRLYSRNDIIGKMSQVYFAAPLSPSKMPSSPVRPEEYRALKTPRISLRFLASYQTFLYLAVMYVFLQFAFGFGPVGYLMFVLLCTLVFGMFRAMTLPDGTKVD
ncbi:sphingomyelin phosphodiesterase 4-like isoform X2 [Mya arenaria]|uniref:sphingomyelin phosphodiesterase 4-like isoform X2 n=1 Tax=Mya arenaria TaxID=6604 RepID=UPI0022E8B769|nr:sphingomyelin phosphodiesterase 4-like isoform X2 [Mya arenaria]